MIATSPQNLNHLYRLGEISRELSAKLAGVLGIQKIPELVPEVTESTVVVVEAKSLRDSQIYLLKDPHFQIRARPIVLFVDHVDSEFIDFAINSAHVFRILRVNESDDQIAATFKIASDRVRVIRERNSAIRNVSVQNRQLEELRGNLEVVAAERTKSTEESKLNAETKQKSMRELVRFIRDLSSVGTLFDLALLIRREFRKNQGLLDPLIYYLGHDHRQRILYFRGPNLTTKILSEKIKPPAILQMNDRNDRQFLANQLARPINKLATIPLRTFDSTLENPPILFVESHLPDVQFQAFVDGMQDRVQSIATALDRLLLEYRLKISSLYWERTFDAITSPVAIVNRQYQTLRANRHFAQESDGEACFKLFAEGEHVCEGCPVSEALQSGIHKRGTIKIHDRVFEVKSFPIILKGQSRTNTVVNHYVDITDERKLYSHMLQNEKMVALGLLAGNLAHELNNPLTGLRSMAQILIKDSQVPEKVRQDLSEIESAAERSQKIVRNLMEFSQIPPEDRLIKTDWNQIVEMTMPLLKTAMRFHNRDVELEESPESIMGDPNLLSQIVFNLVNNGCQAMVDPGTISIRTFHDDTWSYLTVQDTGSGITEELTTKIFDPFFTTKSEGEGTGLGLSMCLSILQKFRGTMDFESVVGEGTTFQVALPIKRKAQS